MFELYYQTNRYIFHIKIDATLLWTVVQVFVLAVQYLNNILS